MEFINMLGRPAGLGALHFIQTIMFLMMVYILLAEYLRTRRSDLTYKLFAGTSIMLMNLLTALVYSLEAYADFRVSEKFFPLMFNALFALVVLALAKAFVYEFISARRAFDFVFRLLVFLVFVIYGVSQYYWLEMKERPPFDSSVIQFAFSSFYLVMLSLIIAATVRYREKYRLRLVIAFGAIVVAHLSNVYAYVLGSTPAVLSILRSSVPLLIPLMFGSVVFKELIEKNVTLTKDLKEMLSAQGVVIHELNDMGSDLGGLSNTLFEKAGESWGRLTALKDGIQKNEAVREEKTLNDTIRILSRDIEEMAGLSDNLKELIDKVNGRTVQLTDMSEKISYVND